MSEKKPGYTIVSYKNTLYDSLIKNIKGKYFQNIINPALIAHIPKENSLGIHFIEQNQLTVWDPLAEIYFNIPLKEFDKYAQISKEQVEAYKKMNDLSKVLIGHENAKWVRENKDHKPNLSSRK